MGIGSIMARALNRATPNTWKQKRYAKSRMEWRKMNNLDPNIDRHYSPAEIAKIMQAEHYSHIPLEDIMNVRKRGVGMEVARARRHIWYIARSRSASRGKTFSLTKIATAWDTDHATVLLGIVTHALDNGLSTLGLSCKRALDNRKRK
jgi:hypothetical protein